MNTHPTAAEQAYEAREIQLATLEAAAHKSQRAATAIMESLDWQDSASVCERLLDALVEHQANIGRLNAFRAKSEHVVDDYAEERVTRPQLEGAIPSYRLTKRQAV